MARQFDFLKLTVIRALRTVATNPSSAAGNSVSGPGRPAGPAGGHCAVAPPGEGPPTGLLNRLRTDRVVSLLQSYEDLLGIGDVKRAQRKVTQIEHQFMEVRETLKKSAQKLHNVQAELRAKRAQLNRTPRDDAKFLEYVTEEHLAIQKERKMEEEHDLLEDTERNTFATLSAAVRESHERQRSQEEKTKYWGVIGSIMVAIISLLGSIIGLLGSKVINKKRMQELQKDIGQNYGQLRDLKGLVTDIRTAIDSNSTKSNGQLRDFQSLVTDIRTAIDSNSTKSNGQLRDFQGLVTDIRTAIDSNSTKSNGQLRDFQGLVTDIRTAIDSNSTKSNGQLRDLQSLVTDIRTAIDSNSTKSNGQLRDLQGLVTDIRTAIDSNSTKSNPEELTEVLEKLSKQQQEGWDTQEKSLTRILKHQEGLLLKEIEGVRRFAAVGTGDMTTLEELVNDAQQKLEWKMSTLSTVVFISGAFALTLPILYSIFK